MSRSYNRYYAQKRVQITPLPTAVNTLVSGNLWIGCRFETFFLSQAGLAMNLGMYTAEEANANQPGTTLISLRNFTDAAAIGAVGEIAFTLTPVDPTKLDATFGTNYRTYVPYSCQLTMASIVTTLLAVQFNSLTPAALYSVLPGSLKIKHSRRTTANVG